MIKFLKDLLSDNKADMHAERIIIIAIAFVAGAALIAGIVLAITHYFPGGMDSNIHQYLGD